MTFILPDLNNIDAFITLLSKLFNNDWKQKEKISAFVTFVGYDAPDTSLDPLYILPTFF